MSTYLSVRQYFTWWVPRLTRCIRPGYQENIAVTLYALYLLFITDQATSNKPAAPMPPPTHMVQTTYLAARRLPSISACATMRLPDMP